MLFEHLINPDTTLLPDADAKEIVSAQIGALDWLDDDTPPTNLPRDRSLARQAFTSMIDGAPPEIQTTHVLQLKSPAAVQHLVGMLSAYDWDFVNQAKELRGYVVAKLVEESKGDKARDRLRALELIGKITEIAAFTERSEVRHVQEQSGEIEERLRARLRALLPPQQPIQDIEVQEIAVVKHAAPKP